MWQERAVVGKPYTGRRVVADKASVPGMRQWVRCRIALIGCHGAL
jgi:hypothetical protein